MDTSKAKTKKAAAAEPKEVTEVTSVSVNRARVVEGSKGDIVFFDMKLNGVEIHSCRVASGKNGDFISWPQQKGKDGNYYNMVYVALKKEDSDKILELVQAELNK